MEKKIMAKEKEGRGTNKFDYDKKTEKETKVK